MSEYDVRCVNCYHKAHEAKECPYCPTASQDNPNARCKESVRADIFIARAVARMEQHSAQMHGQLMMALSAIFDLFQEAYPDAANALQIKLQARQKAAEEEMELQRTKALADADAALMAAKEAEERRKVGELIETYESQGNERSNVLNFPSKSEESNG